MSRVSILLRNSMLLFAGLALFSCAGAQRNDVLTPPVYKTSLGLYEREIINRPDEGRLINVFTNNLISFPVFVFSNLPEKDILQPVCGEALTRPYHCHYIPLSWVGTFAYDKKTTNQLLPHAITFNHGLIEDKEIVVIIDRSKLDNAGTANLNKLMEKFFSVIKLNDDKEAVQLFVQHVGAKQTEYQVLINLPNADLLDAALADLRALPASTALPNEIIRNISSSAILSNDMTSCKLLKTTKPYDTISCYTPEQYQQFRDAKAARKFIALNWNGETEITPQVMRDIAPAKLQEICGQQMKDRTGLSGWQKFCHKAHAQYYPDEPAPTWVIGAPTAEALCKLTTKVVKSDLHGGPFGLSFNDLSNIRTLAVGVYLDSKELDYQHFDAKDKLEKAVKTTLNGRIRLITNENNRDATIQSSTAEKTISTPEALPDKIKANKIDAVLLLWVRQMTPGVNYEEKNKRITDHYQDFTEVEPTEPPAPHKPDPYGKEGGGWHYPSTARGCTWPPNGSEDKWYKEDMKKYLEILLPQYQNEQLPQYQKDHAKWEQDKAEWQRGRDLNPVKYEFSVEETPGIEIKGDMILIDKHDATIDEKCILWSSEIKSFIKNGPSRTVVTLPVQVIGEDKLPITPPETERYQKLNSWQECGKAVGEDTLNHLGEDTICEGFCKLVEVMTADALFYRDLKPWNQSVENP